MSDARLFSHRPIRRRRLCHLLSAGPRRALLVSLLILVLAGAGLVAGLGRHTSVAHASGGCCAHWTHYATAANSAGDWTRLDEICPPGCGPGNTILMVTPNWNPGGVLGGVSDNHPIGVFFSGGSFFIFNQDLTPIPLDAAFNVYPLDDSAQDAGLVQTATSGNSVGNYTCINSPALNGNPTAQMVVTPNWNPGGVGGVYENHPIGVFYNTAWGQWCIFNQDGAAMPRGAAFNVAYHLTFGLPLLQRATSANSTGDATCIDNASLNNQPSAFLLVTPNWNPGGVGGVYDNHNIGVWYNSLPSSPWRGHWCLFNQDGSAIPSGAAFNVISA